MSNKRRFSRQRDEERAEISREHDFAARDLPNWPQEGGRSFGNWWQRRYPHPTRWGRGLPGIRTEPAVAILKGLGALLLVVVAALVIFVVVHG